MRIIKRDDHGRGRDNSMTSGKIRTRKINILNQIKKAN